MEQDMYMKILSLLKEHYDKDPLYFVTSSDLRAKLGVGSVDDIRPYAENLEINRYVYKQEGFFSGMGTNFLLKIRHKGIDALKAGAVEINKECKLHGPEKLKILELLNEKDYYVGKRDIIKATGLDEYDTTLIADEMEYCGLAKRVEATYPAFTLKITDEGKEYLTAAKTLAKK